MLACRIPLQVPAALAASLIYLATGVISGWSSPILPRLQQNTSHIVLTADEASWLAATGGLVSAPASLVAGLLVDVLGRRRMLLGCAVPFFVTGLWQRFATTFWELLVSIFLAAASVGCVLSVFPMYMVETVQDHMRGLLLFFGFAMAGVGSLLMMVVGSYVSFNGVTEFMMAFPVVFFVLFWWMPESPYFLVANHRMQEATQALISLRGKTSEKEVTGELELIKTSLEERTKNEISAADAFRELRRNAGARRAFLITMIYGTVVAFGGSITIGAYSTQIFQTSGSSLDASISAIIISSIQVGCSVFTILLIERVGRKPLVYVSFGGGAVTTAVLGVYFFLKDFGDKGIVENLYWLPLTALILFYISYGAGGGALLWVLTNEMTPAAVRGLSNAFIGVLLSVLGFAVGKLFQVVGDSLGSYVPFWFFAVSGVLGVIFAWFFIPETKGRSLEDITAEMRAKAGGRGSECTRRKGSLQDMAVK